ncbi:MAG TPA: DUF2807 domain-containing protein [Hyphomonadaceae bacterium]|nr:DUF2807 domain-containing protein [Hyphomonadaceae bacterium]
MRYAFGAGMLMLAIAPAVSAETRTYDFKGFKTIEANAAYEIEFTQSPTYSVVVDSEYNNLDQVIVEQHGDTLRITRPHNSSMHHNVHDVVRISAPDLDALKLDAAIKFTTGSLKVDALDINAHAAVTIDIDNLTAGPVTVKAEAATKLDLAGTCSKLDLTLGAATTINASGLKCREAYVDAGTASSVHAYASDKAVAKAAVAASVLISGNPKDFQKTADKLSSHVGLEN